MTNHSSDQVGEKPTLPWPPGFLTSVMTVALLWTFSVQKWSRYVWV